MMESQEDLAHLSPPVPEAFFPAAAFGPSAAVAVADADLAVAVVFRARCTAAVPVCDELPFCRFFFIPQLFFGR